MRITKQSKMATLVQSPPVTVAYRIITLIYKPNIRENKSLRIKYHTYAIRHLKTVQIHMSAT